MRQILLLITLALAAKQMQAVFRSVMPDGRIIYANAPVQGTPHY